MLEHVALLKRKKGESQACPITMSTANNDVRRNELSLELCPSLIVSFLEGVPDETRYD